MQNATYYIKISKHYDCSTLEQLQALTVQDIRKVSTLDKSDLIEMKTCSNGILRNLIRAEECKLEAARLVTVEAELKKTMATSKLTYKEIGTIVGKTETEVNDGLLTTR